MVKIADLDYGCRYDDVYDLNKLSSDEVPESVLDKHIKKAQNEVASILMTGIGSTRPSFSDVEFNTFDLFTGTKGLILYFSDFEDYRYINSVTSVEYRTSEDDSWETLTEGNNDDYNVDYRLDALKFHYAFAGGYRNLRVSGTLGFTTAELLAGSTALTENVSQFIALVSAIMGVVYASGGSYQDVRTVSIGNVSTARNQYGTNFKNQLSSLRKQLDDHVVSCGFRLERSLGGTN